MLKVFSNVLMGVGLYLTMVGSAGAAIEIGPIAAGCCPKGARNGIPICTDDCCPRGGCGPVTGGDGCSCDAV